MLASIIVLIYSHLSGSRVNEADVMNAICERLQSCSESPVALWEKCYFSSEIFVFQGF